MDGIKQRWIIKRGGADSLTVTTDSVFITSSVDAHEVQDVGTSDIMGVYIFTGIDEGVIFFL